VSSERICGASDELLKTEQGEGRIVYGVEVVSLSLPSTSDYVAGGCFKYP
jgi:hypothetical protein